MGSVGCLSATSVFDRWWYISLTHSGDWIYECETNCVGFRNLCKFIMDDGIRLICGKENPQKNFENLIILLDGGVLLDRDNYEKVFDYLLKNHNGKISHTKH